MCIVFVATGILHKDMAGNTRILYPICDFTDNCKWFFEETAWKQK